jgi:hypothetical protein
MFMIILLSAWTIMHLYVLWRLSSVPFVAHAVPKVIVAGAALLLWATIFVSRFWGGRGEGNLATYVEFFQMNWLGTLFLIFVCLLVVDILTGFGFWLHRYVLTLRTLGFLAGLVLATVAFYQGARAPIVRDYEVLLPGLPSADDGLEAVVISDTHIGRLLDGSWLAARVDQIRQLRPDIVFVLGDIFEGHGDS